MKKTIFIILFCSLYLFGENISILKNKDNVYFTYIEDLIKNKNLKPEEIKELLESKNRTIISNMLKGIYADYNENNIVKARKFYNEIIEKVLKDIKNTTEAIYIADFLLREEKYDIINEILTVDYCSSLLNEKEEACIYYLYISKTKLNLNNLVEEKIIKNKYPKYYGGK